MFHVVYSPEWFYGKDIVIDIVSILVLLLVSFFSIRFYKINKNRNNLYLTASFLSLALSFAFKVLMNFKIYYSNIETQVIGTMTLSYNVIESSNLLIFLGSLLYRALALIGLYILYSLYKKQSTSDYILVTILLIGITYFSYSSYYVLHVISLVLLTLIIVQYLKNYIDKSHMSTITMTLSLGLIFFSQVLFMLIGLNSDLYVAAEITQLIGYIGILVTLLMVLFNGKKNKN